MKNKLKLFSLFFIIILLLLNINTDVFAAANIGLTSTVDGKKYKLSSYAEYHYKKNRLTKITYKRQINLIEKYGKVKVGYIAKDTSYSGESFRKMKETVTQKYKVSINLFSLYFGLDPNLVASVICYESAGKPDSLSNAGAYGLMQVMTRSKTTFTATKADNTTKVSLKITSKTINYLKNGKTVKLNGINQKLSGTQYQIYAGCLILKSQIENKFGNLAAGLYAYNNGSNAARRKITNYYGNTNKYRNALTSYKKLGNWIQNNSGYISGVLKFYY